MNEINMDHHSKKLIKNPPYFVLISSNQQLAQVCQQAMQQEVIVLDTEFVRVRTYYPKLGLIQLYDGEQISLIDPINITDFSPFVQLLANTAVLKVLHAASEDLEVFKHEFQQMPTPFLDTQIMAIFLKFPLSTGLAKLVEHYLHVLLDKGESRTDWLQRPLTPMQLNYAADDVQYLLPLYRILAIELQQKQWLDFAKQDSLALIQKQNQPVCAEQAYLTISNAWRLDRAGLNRLQLLAKWRLLEAQKRNLALNFVVKNEHLWQLAKHNPKQTLTMLELGLHPNEVRHHGKTMLHILAQASKISPKCYPPIIHRVDDHTAYKTTFKALQNKLKEITPNDWLPELIGTRRTLEQLLNFVWFQSKKTPILLQTWRKPYGEQLLSVIPTQTHEIRQEER